jgi:CheY-like chemotaxis protein
MLKLQLPSYQGESVLLVEDNLSNQCLIQKLLKATGLKIHLANNGQEAVSMSAARLYDLILMDIEMPIMDGYQATQTILQNKHYINIPIIAITANTSKQDRQKCLDTGMSAHIAKPIDPELFYQTLLQYFPTNLTVSPPLEMDANTHLWPLNELLGIDVSLGLKNFLGDQELYQKILRHFYEDHAHDADNIKLSLKNNDKEKAKRMVHTIKGASSTLGSIQLYQVTMELESILKNEESHEVCLQEFQHLLDEVVSGIAALEKKYNHKKLSVQSEHIINKTKATSIIHELTQQLLQASPQAIELIPELILAVGQEYTQSLEELQEMVDAFDFDEALKKLNQIKECII